MRVAVILLVFGVVPSHSIQGSVHPLTRILTFLQNIQEKTVEAGHEAKLIHDKMLCKITSDIEDLKGQLEDGRKAMEEVEAKVKEKGGEKESLTGEIKQHQMDREAAKSALSEASSIRQQEKANYEKEHEELKTGVAGLSKAIKVLNRVGSTAFLQSDSASTIAHILDHVKLDNVDVSQVQAFLQNTEESPGTGEIMGILNTMMDQMTKDLGEMEENDRVAEKNNEELLTAKNQELDAASKAIEDKMTRKGDVSVEVAQAKNRHMQLMETIPSDEQMLIDLQKQWKDAVRNFDEANQKRQDELQGIQMAMKILGDDETRDMINRVSAKGASFLQVARKHSEAKRKNKAAKIVKKAAAKSSNHHLTLIALALTGKQKGMDGLVTKIKAMIGNLKATQRDEQEKKDLCTEDIQTHELKLKQNNLAHNEKKAKVDQLTSTIKDKKEKIVNLEGVLKKLDESMATETAERKEEEAEFKKESGDNVASMKVLDLAKSVLEKAFKKVQTQLIQAQSLNLPEEDEKEEQHEGQDDDEIEDQAPDFLQVGQAQSVAVKSKNDNVIALIVDLKNEIDKRNALMKQEDEAAQKDYEALLESAKKKRASYSKMITEAAAEVASIEEQMQQVEGDMEGTGAMVDDTKKTLFALHGECDLLLSEFDKRREARQTEVEALKNAIAVLSGASGGDFD